MTNSSAPHDPAPRVSSVVAPDGTTLAYRTTGDPSARALVLVHGWAQSSRAWGEELLAELARDFHVVAVDLRGHGLSSVAEDGYDDPARWADDVQSVLDAAGVTEGAILLGWSYGGIVLCDYLAAKGESAVAGVVLVGATTSISRSRGGRVGEAMMAVGKGGFSDDPKTAIAALGSFGQAMFAAPAGAAQQRMFGLSLATPPEVRQKMLTRRVDNDATLEGLGVPLLAIHGAADGVVLPEAGQANAEMAPQGRYLEIPDCAHAPFAERPEEFLRAVREFAAQL